MRKKPFLDIFVVGAGNGINALLGIMFFTAVARTLPIEDFGKYALLTSLLVSLSKIMDFGTNSLFVAKSITKPQQYINRFFTLKIILFFASILVGGVSLFYLKLLSPETLGIFVVGAIGYGINITLFAYFQRTERFVNAVLLNTIPGAIKAFTAVLVFTGLFTPNLIDAFAVFSFSILSSFLLAFFLPKDFLKAKFNFKDAIEFLRETIPAGISQIIKEGWPAIANTLTKIFRTFSDVGIFSLAQKIADIFTLISMSVFTVLLPKNAHRKNKHQKYDLKETVLLGGGILLLAGIAMIVANYLTVPVFGEKFSDSLSLLNILILAAAVTAIHTFMDNYFFIEEKTKTLMTITIGKLGMFILTAVSLIPRFGLIGLASANLIAALFALVITYGNISRNSNRLS
ncbi:oligosaccharide flippase family protein [candidate division WWE3 bacterium]|jgi:O-antigen/teichoic acid export membrane protein|nr:oligosaccharide flippase family protein [candidate division WWE3 bacterium]MBT7349453.1 oligosaccharide flippase family protein [candidate division WWE3 bacterium]